MVLCIQLRSIVLFTLLSLPITQACINMPIGKATHDAPSRFSAPGICAALHQWVLNGGLDVAGDVWTNSRHISAHPCNVSSQQTNDGTFQELQGTMALRRRVQLTLADERAVITMGFLGFLENGCERGKMFQVNPTDLLKAANGYFRVKKIFVDDEEKLTYSKYAKLMNMHGYTLRSDLGAKKN